MGTYPIPKTQSTHTVNSYSVLINYLSDTNGIFDTQIDGKKMSDRKKSESLEHIRLMT